MRRLAIGLLITVVTIGAFAAPGEASDGGGEGAGEGGTSAAADVDLGRVDVLLVSGSAGATLAVTLTAAVTGFAWHGEGADRHNRDQQADR